MTTEKRPPSYATAVAIAATGAFIGICIYLGALEIADALRTSATPQAARQAAKKPAPLSARDHIRGDSRAAVVIYEYSDLECPYCKTFHSTIKSTLEAYSPDKVAWVYRHHPLPIHDRAYKEAEASECAAAQGGNDAFWAYIDRLFEITPANNKLDPAELEKIARHIGLDVSAFTTCLSSGTYASKVSDQATEGASIGVTGTPSSFVVGPNGYLMHLKGAVPAAGLRQKIDEALRAQ